MTTIEDVVFDKKYKVCFANPISHIEQVITADVLNFNPSGRSALYDSDNSNFYIIRTSEIRWMIPCKAKDKFYDTTYAVSPVKICFEGESITKEEDLSKAIQKTLEKLRPYFK